MDTINEVKMLAAKKGVTLTYLAKYLSENLDKKYNLDAFSKRLRSDRLRYSEMKLIADALGMEILIVDKNYDKEKVYTDRK